MLQRFAAGSLVASVLVACAALIVIVTPGLGPQRAYPLTTLWCFVPAVWGLWAVIMPNTWFPQRLPLWGAILGLVLGQFAALALNVPHAVFGVDVSPLARGLAGVIIAGVYYLLWMLVRLVNRHLIPPPSGT